MKKRLLFFVLFFLTFWVQAEVYKHINEQGEVVFSDEQSADSEPVSIPPVMTYKPTEGQAVFESQPVITKTNYQYLMLISPLDQESIRSNQGAVNISYTLEPQLHSTDTLALYLDGEKQAGLFINGVDRGEHQLYLQVSNKAGEVVIKSEVVTFYLQRHSKL